MLPTTFGNVNVQYTCVLFTEQLHKIVSLTFVINT